jgi:hypothetical protein
MKDLGMQFRYNKSKTKAFVKKETTFDPSTAPAHWNMSATAERRTEKDTFKKLKKFCDNINDYAENNGLDERFKLYKCSGEEKCYIKLKNRDQFKNIPDFFKSC